MRIEQLIGTGDFTLAIYYTPADCYRVAILTASGKLYQPDSIFYVALAAEKEGRRLISTLSRL